MNGGAAQQIPIIGDLQASCEDQSIAIEIGQGGKRLLEIAALALGRPAIGDLIAAGDDDSKVGMAALRA